ncbi:MAG: alpha/beta hydrolase [Lachnospiraceae bacterium]|nr:alpha/beta hydrolase [Lachnospiraceae bacterium]
MSNHKLLKFAIATATTLFAANAIIDKIASSKNKLSSMNGYFYSWKDDKIYYTKTGKGSPILLIHNMNVMSSSYEWNQIIEHLSENHTVYALDLIGCGQSTKPATTYTNYLFVQLINDFCNEIIGEKCDVITSGDSASFVIMANNMHDLFDKIIMINPNDLSKMNFETTKVDMLKKNILFMPLVGTTLYNYYVSENRIKETTANQYFLKSNSDTISYIDASYEAAHLNSSKGKYLFASIMCHYTNIDMKIGLRNRDNLYIIASNRRINSDEILSTYLKVNDKIEISYLDNSKMLPQIEEPEACMNLIEKYLK